MDAIKVENFKKRFGAKIVHRDINLSVAQGQCVGLIGGSGSGKSVILRSLIGLEKADEGRIMIEGEDITHYNERELIPLRKKVAYVFQGGALFDSMSVEANLAYPLIEHTSLSPRHIHEKIKKTLSNFGLQGSEKIMPAALSGGMQKRVGLARAIIMEPKIILYDEPTAGLDPFNTRKIQEKILELKKGGVTSILVTHDMPTAFAVCDRMILIVDGHIVAEGTRTQLENQKGSIMEKFITGEAY